MTDGDDTLLSDDGLSDDGFMGQRIKLLQPKDGYRAGSDAVLLAATVVAEAGQTVLDVGAGVGAISLCLARRCPDLSITGLELQPALANLAIRNIERNNLAAVVKIITGDLNQPPVEINDANYDHVVSNPPYFQQDRGQPPKSTSKKVAHLESDVTLISWLDFCLRRLKPGGCLSIIQRADRLDDILVALQGRAGNIQIFPLWPLAHAAAGRVIVRAFKDRRTPTHLLPGLVMHGKGGVYRDDVAAILRDGEALIF
jgi:FkbM family methyltransferase